MYLFIQAQASSQENLLHLQENNNTSIRSHIELRNEDLKPGLSKVKASQVDSNKIDMEKYKQFYLEELQVRTLLVKKRNK